jgi:hypothetical protein
MVIERGGGPLVALSRLPTGFEVGGGLMIGERTSLKELPSGLTVHGDLCLNWSDIESLPTGLVVDGDLFLDRAERWDGDIPHDAVIGGRIYTEKYPYSDDGDDEFRRHYPEGLAQDRMGMSLREFRQGGPDWRLEMGLEPSDP